MAKKKEKLVLVDGSALLYRAFFAIPGNFSTKDGLPTNAVYGFATMFKKLFKGRKVDRGAVVFDAPGKTFRDDKYPEYKSQRPSMPGDLREQLRHIDRVVEAHLFPLLRVSGFEADDVIGTLAKLGEEQGMEVVIVSSDKDFAQLISDDVKMLDTLKDVTFDPDLVRKKWFVPPHQFVDFLAIMGDKADNIPGAPGVGQKGAATLLEKYGSLDEILAHADNLKGRQKTAFTEHKDVVLLSRELATIDCQVPLEVTLDDLRLQEPKQDDLNALYKELEFFSLLKDAGVEHDEERELDAAVAKNAEDVKEYCRVFKAAESVALLPIFDDNAVHGVWVGLAACVDEKLYYVPFEGEGGLGTLALDCLRDWLEDGAPKKSTYNFKFLYALCEREGISLRGVVGDVLLASFLVDPTKIIPHGMNAVSKEFLHQTLPSAKKIRGSGKSQRRYQDVPVVELAHFAAEHVEVIFKVWPMLLSRLQEIKQLRTLHEVDMPLSIVLAHMERTGILVDVNELKNVGEEFQKALDVCEERIHKAAGQTFNINSTKQLSRVLFDDMGLPVIKKTKSGYSTNVDVLQKLSDKGHNIADEILAYRKLAKLINTYTDVLQREVRPETGRVHATFQQTVGATGRLITTDPDLQRTPIKTKEGKRIREAFVARPGFQIVSADWSQIELRILAHFSGDPGFAEAFTTGQDIHTRTATQIFGIDEAAVTRAQRDVAKTVNFATIYGQGASALGQQLKIPRKEAQTYIAAYFAAYHGVRRWLDDTVAAAHDTGFVETLLGRKRFIPELSSNSFMDRAAGERIAANTPIQGTGADICKLAMLNLFEAFSSRNLQAKMLLQIHDELLFEVPEQEIDEVVELIRHEMESVVKLDVPLVVDVGVGKSWAEAH
ncbi:MAG: DNA polymerase I [Deltaproteobacteria bacterium]|nr:DNA polymerase I [Deltaproteobacteria bacterium]